MRLSEYQKLFMLQILADSLSYRDPSPFLFTTQNRRKIYEDILNQQDEVQNDKSFGASESVCERCDGFKNEDVDPRIHDEAIRNGKM